MKTSTLARCIARTLPVMASLVLMSAQSLPPEVRFEVASVRLNTAGGGRSIGWAYKGETFTIANSPLRTTVRLAYGIDPVFVDPWAFVEGEPSWIGDRYDIVAKTAGPVPVVGTGVGGFGPPLRTMLQSLLAERFRMAVHWESRPAPGAALVLVNRDGRLGPNVRASNGNCEAYNSFRTADSAARASGAPRPIPPPLSPAAYGAPSCGARSYSKPGVPLVTEFLMGRQPLKILVDRLAQDNRLPIVDRTGLSGLFDLSLTYSSSGLTAAPPGSAGQSPLSADVAPGAATLVEALRDQLGLRLEPERVTVGVLVIDALERPAPN